MLDRSRTTQLSLAGVCFALFALLAVAFKQEWALFVDLDDASREWRDWVVDTSWLHDPLRWVEVAFGTVGMTVLTTVLAVAMFAKGYRRAAALHRRRDDRDRRHHHPAEAVVDRDRPVWQATEHLLETNAFPSGHASSITAFAGIVMVLVAMLVRRANLRRLVYAGMVLVVLLVVADRVLLGRHYLTDVTAGVLLGAGFVLLGPGALQPAAPQPRREGRAAAAGGAPRTGGWPWSSTR